MTVYLAGPMSGYPELNAPAFRSAARQLRGEGYEVVSPVEMDEAEGLDFTKAEAPTEDEYFGFLRRDILRIIEDRVEALFVLPGWEESRGAAAEVELARNLGFPIISYETREPVKRPTAYKPPSDETVAEEADRLVNGDRNEDYGPPWEDFTRTAKFASVLLEKKLTEPIEPREVPLLMIAVKLSRLVQSPLKRDSLTDLVGYALTYEQTVGALDEGLR